MLYESKVITQDALRNLLFFDRLCDTTSVNYNCHSMSREYDFSEYSWVGKETIISKCFAYIDDTTLDWTKPQHGKFTLCSINTKRMGTYDDYLLVPTKQYEALTDITHQNNLQDNDMFRLYLQFYKQYGHLYDYEAELEDWNLAIPLTMFTDYIESNKDNKFRGTTDLETAVFFLSDRYDLYKPMFEKHRYSCVASDAQIESYNKFFD